MGVCNWSLFCCTLLYVHSSIAIILIGKRELDALLNLSPWYLVMVVLLFLAVPWGCLRFVIVVFPDHTHLLFIKNMCYKFCFCCSINRKYKIKLERAADGAPSQIPTQNFLNPSTPATPSPTPGAWSRHQNKNPVQYVLYLLFVRTHIKFGIKIFEINFAIVI